MIHHRDFVTTLTFTAAAATAGALVLNQALVANRREWARNLPKAELHVHLDGSLRPSTFLKLLAALRSREAAVVPVLETERDIHENLCFQKGWDLARCLQSFGATLQVLQTSEALELVAFELCEDLASEGVVYGEIRYCPALHQSRGLSLDQVVCAVARGIRRFELTMQSSKARGTQAAAVAAGVASSANNDSYGAVSNGDKANGGISNGIERGGAPRPPPRHQFRQIVTALRDLGPENAVAMANLASKWHSAHKQNQSLPSSSSAMAAVSSPYRTFCCYCAPHGDDATRDDNTSVPNEHHHQQQHQQQHPRQQQQQHPRGTSMAPNNETSRVLDDKEVVVEDNQSSSSSSSFDLSSPTSSLPAGNKEEHRTTVACECCGVGFDSGAGKVVAIDLAGNEGAHPPQLFKQAFDTARESGLGLTCHAGEGSDESSADNVTCAVNELGCRRIGHGVAALFHGRALDCLNEAGCFVETCATSNCHTCPAVPDVLHSPAPFLWRHSSLHLKLSTAIAGDGDGGGLTCSPCADNTLLSRTSTSEEYVRLLEHASWTHALNHAFRHVLSFHGTSTSSFTNSCTSSMSSFTSSTIRRDPLTRRELEAMARAGLAAAFDYDPSPPPFLVP